MKFLSTQFERTSLCESFFESKFSPVNPISAWRIFEKGSDRLAKIHITPLTDRLMCEKLHLTDNCPKMDTYFFKKSTN